MIIETTRFGKVQVQETDLLHFNEGILGFSDLHKFVILDDPSDDIFAWMQSCDEPSIAFPVLEPELITDTYQITLAKSDSDALQLLNKKQSCMFSIITIPDDPTQMTANLKAPVVINRELKIARQCVLQDNQLAIREPIFARLQQRVVASPNTPLKDQSSEALEVAVKLPAIEKLADLD